MNRRVKKVKKRRSKTLQLSLFRRSANRTDVSLKKDKTKSTEAAPQKRVSTGYVMLLVLIVFCITVAFVFHLSVRFEGIRLGYETSKERSTQTRLLLERRELRLELASLKSPHRVEVEAKERLDMSVPDHRKIITIGKKRRLVSVSGGAL